MAASRRSSLKSSSTPSAAMPDTVSDLGFPTLTLRKRRPAESSSITEKRDTPHIHKKERCTSLCKNYQHLFVCFMLSDSSNQPVSYSIWFVPIVGLLVDSSHKPDDVRFLFSWTNKDECFRRRFITIGTRLYLLGGQMRDNGSGFCSYSLVTMSKDLFYFDLYKGVRQRSLRSFDCLWPLKGMQTGKSEPIAVEIGGKLYVLAGLLYSDSIPDPCFEVYDSGANTWSALKSPPLFIKSSKYFLGTTADPLAYVVIGNKLCISSQHASFAYDTLKRRWEACKLFDGFYGDQWGEKVPGIDDEMGCGPPFPFRNGAILYDGNILICAGTPPLLAVAYHVDHGVVVKKQGLLLENAYDTSCDYLFRLRGSYFCCIYLMHPENKNDPKFSLVTFKISKICGALRSDWISNFLKGEVVSILNQRIESQMPFLPVYSFAF